MATYYFSGQGIFYVAERILGTGLPKNFVDLCNVSAMEISIDVTKFEHKESKTGQRAIDLTIIQEKNGTFTLTLENINSFNLALAMFGTKSVVAAATISNEILPIHTNGGFFILDHMNLDPGGTFTLVTVEGVAAATFIVSTAYALGSVVLPISPNGRFYKAIVGGTSDTSEPTFPVGVGLTVSDNDITWEDQGLVVLVEDTNFTVNHAHGTLKMLEDFHGGGNNVDITYDHLGYSQVDALTETSQIRWLRFEGLNTVDDLPVVVDIFKASLDPLTGYGIINEEIAQMEVTGNILLDDLRPSGEQFFRQRQVGDVDNSCVKGGQ